MAHLRCLLNRSIAVHAPLTVTLSSQASTLRGLRIERGLPRIGIYVPQRHAQHQAQGRANGAKDGPGKRLGAKKTAGQYVVPGNILFKQRGTHWFPGDNCYMGRDHTIHAGAPGYVRYYRDPVRHQKRKYIGVALEKEQSLPQHPNAPRRRQLGMLAYQMPQTMTEQVPDHLVSSDKQGVVSTGLTTSADLHLTVRPGHQYRATNWQIGRVAELAKRRDRAANVEKVLLPEDGGLSRRKGRK